MTTRRQLTAFALIFSTLAFSTGIPASADPPRSTNVASFQLPVTGTATGGATFAGTFRLVRFANHGGRAVAVGFIQGTLTSAAGASLGTGVVGPVEFPVTVSGSGATSSALQSSAAPAPQQQTCDLLNLDLGSIAFDLLGLQVNTMPLDIVLTATGEGTDVLGRLICVVLETVGNVVGLVNLLNQILGLLGGLGGGIAP